MLMINYPECKTSFFPPRDYQNIKDIFLLTFNFVVSILNFTLNLLVIFMIFKTKQYHNKSVLLVLILSCSDVITALVSQPLIVYMLYVKSFYSISCSLSIAIQFIFFFSPYFSVFTIAFIVYDRYLRITYLKKYDKYMTQRRFLFGVFLVLCATMFQNIIVVIATLRESTELGGWAILPLNVLTMLFEIMAYTKTISKLRQYKRECKKKNFHTAAENSFTRLAAAYLLMILLFFTPFMIANTVYAMYTKTSQSYLDIQYTWLMTQVLYCFNSFANAAIFLRVNRKANVALKLFLRRCLKTRLDHAQMGHKRNVYHLGMRSLRREKSMSFDLNNNNNFFVCRTESTKC